MAERVFVFGAEKLAARLRTIRERTSVTLNSEDLKKRLLKRMLDRFDREVDPDGIPWPEIKESTLRRRKYPTPRRGRPAGQGKKILNATGLLRSSIGIIRGNPTGFAIATGAGFRIGIKNPLADYGAFHQRGQGVTQRVFLGIGRLDVKSVDSLLYSAIIRASGLK